MKHSIFDVSLKKIGLINVDIESREIINSDAYKAYIKILYLSKGCTIKVDFDTYITEGSTLFFISPNQVLHIESLRAEAGYLIYYNRDFYCIQIHDEEVACDGLLFNNINNMPMTIVPHHEVDFIDYLFTRIKDEF